MIKKKSWVSGSWIFCLTKPGTYSLNHKFTSTQSLKAFWISWLFTVQMRTHWINVCCACIGPAPPVLWVQAIRALQKRLPLHLQHAQETSSVTLTTDNIKQKNPPSNYPAHILQWATTQGFHTWAFHTCQQAAVIREDKALQDKSIRDRNIIDIQYP